MEIQVFVKLRRLIALFIPVGDVKRSNIPHYLFIYKQESLISVHRITYLTVGKEVANVSTHI